MIAHEDAAAAIDWLSKAFWFEEDPSQRHVQDGRVTHAELSLAGATVMVANPSPEYVSPRRHREECEVARRALDNPWAVDGNFVVVLFGEHRPS